MKFIMHHAQFLILYFIVYIPCVALGLKWWHSVLVGLAAVLWMFAVLVYYIKHQED